MAGDIRVGDLVELRSGGPLMEVVAIAVRADDQQPMAICVWSGNDGELRRDDFPIACVTKLN